MEDAQRFESIFKMPRRTFNYICSLVKDDMMVRASSYTFLDGTVLSLAGAVSDDGSSAGGRGRRGRCGRTRTTGAASDDGGGAR